MRILTITNLYPNLYQPYRAVFNRQQLRAPGGAALYSDHCPDRLDRRVDSTPPGAAPLPASRCVVHDGITIDHPRYAYTPGVLRGWHGHFFRRSIRQAFGRALAEFRPDLVYATWAYPDGWAAIELGHCSGLPVVVKVHGSDVLMLDCNPGRMRPQPMPCGGPTGSLPSAGISPIGSWRGADPCRVAVVYNGVDAALFHPSPREAARARLGLVDSDPVLLFVGNLVPVKGLDVLVEACTILAADGVRFACYLIGQGPLEGWLEARIARRGLGGRFRLLGPRSHDQLPDWFRAADLFVLPSRSEGVPNVLLEATACGTPFVASRVGGIPEIAHLGTGRLVPPEDAPALARAIRDQLADSDRRPAHAAPGRSHAEAADEIVGLFEQVVRDHWPVAG